MNGIKLRIVVAKVVLAAACALSAAVAQAAIYISNFDPIDFFGVAVFDVGPGCLAVDGLHANDGVGCTVGWLEASVTLTNAPDPDLLSFDFSAFLPSTAAVLAVEALGGELVGVHSTAIGPVVIGGDPVAEFNGSFSLMFDGDLVSLFESGHLVATADALFFRVAEPAAPVLLLLALGACGLVHPARRART